MKVQTDYCSIDDFFDDISDEAYNDHESICILTVDTKIPLIKIEKNKIKNTRCYKFIVDITNENDDNFSIKSIIYSKDKFINLLQLTSDSLNNNRTLNNNS